VSKNPQLNPCKDNPKNSKLTKKDDENSKLAYSHGAKFARLKFPEPAYSPKHKGPIIGEKKREGEHPENYAFPICCCPLVDNPQEEDK
jgi:hypothetical protein